MDLQIPIQYFVPSIGISEIVKLSIQMSYDSDKKKIIFGALGTDNPKETKSLHFIVINEDYSNLEKHEIVNINSRVRDLITIDEDIYFSYVGN